MSFPSTDKTFEGLLRDQQQRVQLLERRQKMPLPARLGGSGGYGEQTIDWNQAVDSGFYQSNAEAWNAPYPFYWNGVVSTRQGGAGPEPVQRLTRVGFPVEYVRSKWQYGSNLSLNSQPVSGGLQLEWSDRFGFAKSFPGSGGADNGAFVRFTCPSTQDSNARGWDIYGNPDLGNPGVNERWIQRWVYRGDTIKVGMWIRSWNSLTMFLAARVHDNGAWKTSIYDVAPGNHQTVNPGQWKHMEWTFQAAETGYISLSVRAEGGQTMNANDVIDVQWLDYNYPNGMWTRWRRSDGLMQPRSIEGGGWDNDLGRIYLSGSNNNISLNSVFVSEIRSYRVFFELQTNGQAGAFVRFRTLGQNSTASNVEYQGTLAGGTTLSAIQGVTNSISWPSVGAWGWNAELIIENPMEATTARRKRCQSHWGSNGSPSQTTLDSNMADTSSYDGLYFEFGSNFEANGSWITVQALG